MKNNDDVMYDRHDVRREVLESNIFYCSACKARLLFGNMYIIYILQILCIGFSVLNSKEWRYTFYNMPL